MDSAFVSKTFCCIKVLEWIILPRYCYVHKSEMFEALLLNPVNRCPGSLSSMSYTCAFSKTYSLWIWQPCIPKINKKIILHPCKGNMKPSLLIKKNGRDFVGVSDSLWLKRYWMSFERFEISEIMVGGASVLVMGNDFLTSLIVQTCYLLDDGAS